MVNVQKVFGKFAVEINGEVKLFDTESEARSAAVLVNQEAAFDDRVNSYLTAKGLDLESKMAKGKSNVIKDFLAYEASFRAAVQPEAKPEEPEAPEESTPEEGKDLFDSAADTEF